MEYKSSSHQKSTDSMSLADRLGESWYQLLKGEFQKDYFKELAAILKEERSKYEVYPPSDEVFNAFRSTPFDKTKVVILGQDPYFQPNQAHGLAFSVKNDWEPTPPTLDNIFEEIERDLDFKHIKWSNNLTSWANQGVLLLNRYLTVRRGMPLKHYNIGWETFTDKVIETINTSAPPVVFMLWGNDAKYAGKYLDRDHHLVLEASHPSPRSKHLSFVGCGHFSRCNEFLKNNNQQPINWITTYEND